jgi:acyl carrier protein
VTVTVVAADIANAMDVDRLLSGIPASAPLRGIVHAAGIDKPVPLAKLQGDDFRAVFAGKARGAWLLHEQTRGTALDFFVNFSSMSSLLGAQNRAHYSAANAFLDALVAERRRLDQQASAINWGPWSGGGIASADDLAHFERIGNRAVAPAAAVQALGSITARNRAHTLVADVNWETFRSVYEARRSRPILAELREVPASGSGLTGAVAPWVERLRAAEAGTRLDQLASLLRNEVADTLGFDSAESVPTDVSFYDLGMDSLMMADLIGRLRKRVGVSCTALVFNNPNVRALAPLVLEQLTFDARPQDRRAPEPVDAPPKRSRFDESEVIAFQRHAYPHRQADLLPARWRWMFVDSARRLGVEPRFWVHREDDRIVGHMGSIPVRVKIGQQQLDTGWLVDTMVLKEYRAQAVGSRLMVEAHEDQPFSLSLGQTAEMREIQLRLGWKQVAPLAISQLLVRPTNVLKGKVPVPAAWAAEVGLRASHALRGFVAERVTLTTRCVDRFDERHDRLWHAVSGQVPCAVVRDASYLNWKYVDQPGQSFLRLDVLDGGDLAGTVVWMFREPDGDYRYRRAFLVDIVAPFGDAARLQQIVKAASEAAAARDADALLCHHVNGRLTAALRACGFLTRKPQRYFLVDIGGLEPPMVETMMSADNWLVTHGDSDIDRPW